MSACLSVADSKPRLRPSQLPTVKAAAQEDCNPRSNTWYFTFDMLESLGCEGNVISQSLRATESSDIRKKALKKSSILSFSTSADGSPGVRGFISGEPTRQNLVARSLTSNPRVIDLQLTRIHGRSGGGRRISSEGCGSCSSCFVAGGGGAALLRRVTSRSTWCRHRSSRRSNFQSAAVALAVSPKGRG
jgi:hypothetical protein